MDKLTLTLLGAVAGVTAAGSAHAASSVRPDVSSAAISSYAELLAPIPDAAAQLRAEDAARAAAPHFELAQAYLQFQYGPPPPPPAYYGYPAPIYHHHHHHHRYYRNHHHHHHHHGYGRS